MKPFMDKSFMIHNATGEHLYEAYAKNMPLIDYHCHISPQEIYEDRRFENIAQVWLGGRNPDGTYFGDHYKWRIMRTHGVPEETVTGGVDPFDKFLAFTKSLEMAIGNPMYHWCNLELKTYFGATEPLTEANAKAVWDKANDMLQHDANMTVRGIIRQSNVAYIGTTDDPIDDLKWHEKIAADKSIEFKVCPSFRPDKAINITKAGFREYMAALAKSVGKESLADIDAVLSALSERIAHFKKHGCRASDHGLDYCVFRPASKDEVNRVYQRAMKGEAITVEDAEKYQTAVLLHLGREYHAQNIAMEIHYSCRRDNNERMFKIEGPDTGFDMIAQTSCIGNLAQFMSELDKTGDLPKMVLFSLDSTDFDRLATLMGCFQSDEMPGKIQLGPAWWFLDTRDGMEKQLRSLARLSLMGDFIGMLTDSRSFLSYTRHDYFRRILCNLVGEWVEKGEYPNHEESLKKIIEGICYNNAARYFGI